jgi:hypothetical protein
MVLKELLVGSLLLYGVNSFARDASDSPVFNPEPNLWVRGVVKTSPELQRRASNVDICTVGFVTDYGMKTLSVYGDIESTRLGCLIAPGDTLGIFLGRHQNSSHVDEINRFSQHYQMLDSYGRVMINGELFEEK